MNLKLGGLLAICLLSQLFLSVEADFNLRESAGNALSWFKSKWSQAKDKVKGAINQIKGRSPQPELRHLQATTRRPSTILPEEPIVCGVNKYERDNSINEEQITTDGGRAVRMRLSGGRSAKPNEVPWQIRVLIDGVEQCGATVLNSRTLITAAHCAEAGEEWRYQLFLAEHRLRLWDRGERVIGVSKIVPHPRYDADDTWVNDFALLITDRELNFNHMEGDTESWRVRPVCMPRPGDFAGELAGLGVNISGWGHANSRENGFAPVLQIGHVRVMNHYVCRRRYQEIKDITPEMLCAAFDRGHVFVDSCAGDSGGGMTTLKNGQHHLVGVTSFGLECDNKDRIPGVYGRVTSVFDWIQSNAMGALHYSD